VSALAAPKLHLGCGSTVVPGWVNIDRSPSVKLARVPKLRRLLEAGGVLAHEQAVAVFPPGIVHADVRHGLAYPSGTVRYIYSSHLIEHLAHWRGLALVRECARVLQPGGLVRLATPDLARIVADYEDARKAGNRAAADTFMANLLTYAERPGSVVASTLQRLFTAPHQWLYDRESLRLLLEEGGFTDIRDCGYRDSELPDIELLEHRDGSLFVEARR
jgi:predicted SAM-dependent methyltransferase